jgi:hypothetical protein
VWKSTEIPSPVRQIVDSFNPHMPSDSCYHSILAISMYSILCMHWEDPSETFNTSTFQLQSMYRYQSSSLELLLVILLVPHVGIPLSSQTKSWSWHCYFAPIDLLGAQEAPSNTNSNFVLPRLVGCHVSSWSFHQRHHVNTLKTPHSTVF